jgi:putative ATP-dependent endonuclease of the OLD family
MRYLRRVTLSRPELQLIVSTHSGEMLSAAKPEDIVVMRRTHDGARVTRNVAALPLEDATRARVLRLTELHFDASRTASLFAGRLVLVEGVTDALLVRQFGLAWAGDDAGKRDFIDALTIVPMGSKVGEWCVQLLATPDHELADRVGVLRDTDDRSGADPEVPAWIGSYSATTVQCFLNHPTLEPAITPGNEELVAAAIDLVGLEVPDPVTAQTVDELFRGPGGPRKGEFAFALAGLMRDALDAGNPTIVIPERLEALFTFLYPSEGDAGGTLPSD